MIEVKENSFIDTNFVIVQMGISKEYWEMIQESEEWKAICEEKPLTFDKESEKTSLLNEVLGERYLLVKPCYFENMKESFEKLLLALTSNSSGNIPRAIENLEYIRRGLDLKLAKASSEKCKKQLLSADKQIFKPAEPSEIPFRDGND